MLRKRGRSTLEYVIILTAIVAGIIYAATKFVKPKVQESLQHVSEEMKGAVDKIEY